MRGSVAIGLMAVRLRYDFYQPTHSGDIGYRSAIVAAHRRRFCLGVYASDRSDLAGITFFGRISDAFWRAFVVVMLIVPLVLFLGFDAVNISHAQPRHCGALLRPDFLSRF